jgi:hypothetical protein
VYLAAVPIRKLFLAEAALRLRTGEPRVQRAALADLTDDVRLWRAVRTGRGALISKMIAIAYLQGDYLVLADMIADSRAAVPMGPADADVVAPLFALGDRNIGSAFSEEFRAQAVRRQGIEPAGIPAFLARHPEWSTHPGDDRPFLWDAKNGELRVQTMGRQQPGRRFSIRIWQPHSAG